MPAKYAKRHEKRRKNEGKKLIKGFLILFSRTFAYFAGNIHRRFKRPIR